MNPVFSTSRMIVRKLELSDLPAFHEMQGNPKVMQYTTGRAATLDENRIDLQGVIASYSKPENDFWVWAILEKSKNQFVGTCALIKNEKGEREIGYRFLERFWGNGFGKEIAQGLIQFGLSHEGIDELVAYVDKENIASVRILDAAFEFVKEYFSEEEKCWERYYRTRKYSP